MTCDPSLARRPWREDLPFVLLPRPSDSSLVEPGTRRPETGHGRMPVGGWLLTRTIHDGSRRNREVASREGRVEARRRETYSLQYVDRLSGEPARLHAA